MLKRVSLFLALLLVFVPVTSMAEAMTDVGTPRAQTLICEPDAGVYAAPGQFNPYMTGTQASWGMHQIMWCDGLWDLNTMTGQTIPMIAADLAVPNDDFTEWTITIREGLKWSDGEALDANDVFFTFNQIMNTEGFVDRPYYNGIFEKAELIDDLTIKIYCKAPFTRIMTTLGVAAWGCGFRVIPEHIYGKVDDILSFPDSTPVAADAYVMKEYDPLGTWILYEKRADWADTPTGRVFGEPGPQYVLYRVFGSQEARVMAMINNEVDVMNEVAYEDLKVMLAQNPNVNAWYPDFPLANTDDACAKGLFLNTGIAPFDDINVRWALTLCCDFIEVSENVFEGIGRMSALPIPAITAMENFYYKPMSEWLSTEFTIDGEYNPWDKDFALKLAAALEENYGYDLSAYDEEGLKAVFGSGYWKTDKEKAAELMAGAGYELKDGKWYKDGELFVVSVIVCPEEDSTQASRSGKALADQWEKFGVTVELTTVATADMFNRINIGDFQAASSWDACSGYRVDFYNNISGWNNQTHSYPIGEKATGISSYRLPQSDPERSDEISALVRHIATLDPNGDEVQAALTEFLKLTTAAHVGITVHAGTKIVPFNSTYWTGFPSSENPYEGPWWWWSLMRGIVANLSPAE